MRTQQHSRGARSRGPTVRAGLGTLAAGLLLALSFPVTAVAADGDPAEPSPAAATTEQGTVAEDPAPVVDPVPDPLPAPDPAPAPAPAPVADPGTGSTGGADQTPQTGDTGQGAVPTDPSTGGEASRDTLDKGKPGPKTGTLVVTKVTNPATDLTWAFSVAGNSVSLGNGGVVSYELKPGFYQVSENSGEHPLWNLSDMTCTISGKDSAPAAQEGLVGVNRGVEVKENRTTTCVFTNTSKTKPLVVTKVSADPDYKSAYSWAIDKVVDKPVKLGHRAAFTFTVTATPSAGYEDAKVSGTVRISNPNHDRAAVAKGLAVVVSSEGLRCSLTGPGLPAQLAANESVQVRYTCVPDSFDPGLAGTVTATASWTGDGSSSLVSGSAEGTAAFDFSSVTPQQTGRYADLDDDWLHKGKGTTFDATKGEQTFTYKGTLKTDPGTCTSKTNTATLSWGATGGHKGHKPPKATVSDSVTVHLCDPADLEVDGWAEGTVVSDVTWSIDKTGPGDVEADPDSGEATLDWEVTVTEGPVDHRDATLEGSFDITNPNEFLGVLASARLNVPGASCSLSSGSHGHGDRAARDRVWIGAGGTASVDFSCTFAEVPEDWDIGWSVKVWVDRVSVKGDIALPKHLHLGNASFHDTTVLEEVEGDNHHITVTDSQFTFDPLWLITWSEEGTTHVKSYSTTVDVAAGTCVTVRNTATIVDTDQSATAWGEACRDPYVAPAVETGEPLAATGSADMGALGVASLLALLGGAGALVVRRRR